MLKFNANLWDLSLPSFPSCKVTNSFPIDPKCLPHIIVVIFIEY